MMPSNADIKKRKAGKRMIKCPENELITIEKGELLSRCMEMKKSGLRLSQACAAFCDGNYELSYSFADDETYEYKTLRLPAGLDEEIPSITDIIPTAVFYENEMAEMYGVKIQMISLDYHNKLYRIEEEAPLLPKDAKSTAQ